MNLYNVEYETYSSNPEKEVLIVARSVKHLLEEFDRFYKKQHYGTIEPSKLRRITRLYSNVRLAK